MKRIVCIIIFLIWLIGSSGDMLGQVLTPNARFLGTHSLERVGYVISDAGDVNGDGFDDFIIGTFHNMTFGWNSGAVYLILGKTEFDWGMDFSLNNADARFLGSEDEGAGYSISGGGDINGDGVLDILDVLLIVDIILENFEPTVDQFAAADYDGSGSVNVIDVVNLVLLILGNK